MNGTLPGLPPLLERAAARKENAKEAEKLSWQLKKKEEELLAAQTRVKLEREEKGDLIDLIDLID